MSPWQLQQVMGVKPSLATAWAPIITKALELSECNTIKRQAAWLSQVGHESGCLRYTREIWGPTAQQRKYEPITLLSGRLGNTEPGDGHLFLGRGLIQITGRANYRMCAERMAQIATGVDVPDFEEFPEALERPMWAALSAALYWRTKRLNKWADSGEFTELTRRINGGYNGLAHRQQLYIAAMGVIHA